MSPQRAEQPSLASTRSFHYPSPVILAVDDSPEVRGLLNNTLGRVYTVLLASNGIEAIERLQQVHVDLILTDISMPEMGGIELSDFVRRHYPHIKLAFVSSCLDAETQRLIACRSKFSLAKPFTLSALRGVLAQLMA